MGYGEEGPKENTCLQCGKQLTNISNLFGGYFCNIRCAANYGVATARSVWG